MLFYFLITCFPFFFFLKSLSLRPLPLWTSEARLLSLWFWKDLTFFPISGVIKNSFSVTRMSFKKISLSSKVENVEDAGGFLSVLDLPELALECIIERLPPSGLRSMAGVCSSLRDRCTSDHFWEKHMKQKWGKLIGPAAYREWQLQVAVTKDRTNLKQAKPKGLLRILSSVRPFSWIRPKVDESAAKQTSFHADSIMSWYLALQTGRFRFPAQVYNRENGHVGFMLSCYDAELCYDAQNDSFSASYPPHGRRPSAIENGVHWDRLRAPPVDTKPHDLHVSDCLNDLRPGDHIEIQWRRNKEFPYGWWYGVVGHLESCDGNQNYCLCHNSAYLPPLYALLKGTDLRRPQHIQIRKLAVSIHFPKSGSMNGLKLFSCDIMSSTLGLWRRLNSYYSITCVCPFLATHYSPVHGPLAYAILLVPETNHWRSVIISASTMIMCVSAESPSPTTPKEAIVSHGFSSFDLEPLTLWGCNV